MQRKKNQLKKPYRIRVFVYDFTNHVIDFWSSKEKISMVFFWLCSYRLILIFFVSTILFFRMLFRRVRTNGLSLLSEPKIWSGFKHITRVLKSRSNGYKICNRCKSSVLSALISMDLIIYRYNKGLNIKVLVCSKLGVDNKKLMSIIDCCILEWTLKWTKKTKHLNRTIDIY